MGWNIKQLKKFVKSVEVVLFQKTISVTMKENTLCILRKLKMMVY